MIEALNHKQCLPQVHASRSAAGQVRQLPGARTSSGTCGPQPPVAAADIAEVPFARATIASFALYHQCHSPTRRTLSSIKLSQRMAWNPGITSQCHQQISPLVPVCLSHATIPGSDYGAHANLTTCHHICRVLLTNFVFALFVFPSVAGDQCWISSTDARVGSFGCCA